MTSAEECHKLKDGGIPLKTGKILNIVPIAKSEALEAAVEEKRAYCRQIEEETNGLVFLETRVIEDGSTSMGSAYDAAFSLPYVLKLAQEAQNEGFDAVILDCFTDVALAECRELLQIPVIGPCQAACLLAMQLGGDFSIVCILENLERSIRENLARYGIPNALASIPMLDIPISDFHLNQETLINRIVDLGYRAVKEHQAKALVLGCTGLFTVTEPVSVALKEKGIEVPVIEPFRTAVFDAISCVMMGISHSKAAFMPVSV